MNVNQSTHAVMYAAGSNPSAPGSSGSGDNQDGELRSAFDSFVGEVFFGQLLKAMRNTVGKPAYFHGGRAEEIFQQQLDQVLAQKLSQASAEKFSGPMFELFTLGRK